MAVKGGQILHAMDTFVVDRIQTGGPGDLNIPQEKIYELGNFETVATVRDIPDLSFNLECLDVSTEVEALLVGSVDPQLDAFDSTLYEIANAIPIDIISPWKSAQGAFDIVKGVAIPQLTLESASYRYGLNDNAGETFTLRGDSVFYIPGTPRNQIETGDGVTAVFAFDDAALKYNEQGEDIYALNVSVDGVRQRRGDDYTDTTAGVTFTAGSIPAVSAVIKLTYGTATVDNYPQTVHQGVSVKPAAIKGKDIKVYVGLTTDATPAPDLWSNVQSVTVDYRRTLEDDFEFGNPRAVERDYTGPPDVTGSIDIKPQTAQSLFDKLEQITGVAAPDIIGPQSSVTLPVEVVLLNPDSGGSTAQSSGDVLKTLYVPDARFTIPGYDGRANEKLIQSFAFTSDAGTLEIYKGDRF